MLRGRVVAGGLVLGLLAGGAAGLSGCGKSGYQFVENEDRGVFARLPDDWAVYDEREWLAPELDEKADADEIALRVDGVWFRGFDASDDPSVDGTFALGETEPRGYVQIMELTVEQREQVNLDQLRRFPTRGLVPIDVTGNGSGNAAGAGAAPGQASALVALDEPVEFDGGYHGVHTVLAIGQGDGVAVLDQTVVLDATNDTIYVFFVSCEQDCYLDTHEDEIHDLVDSWTIQEDGR